MYAYIAPVKYDTIVTYKVNSVRVKPVYPLLGCGVISLYIKKENSFSMLESGWHYQLVSGGAPFSFLFCLLGVNAYLVCKV